jgi:hypothetical protein
MFTPTQDSKFWGTPTLRKRHFYFLFTVLLTTAVLFFMFVSSPGGPAGIFHKFGLYDTSRAQDFVNDSSIVFPTDSPQYLLFEPPKQEQAPTAKFNEIYDTKRLPLECLDAHIAKGAACNFGLDPRLDVIWTWVNGSDKLLMESMSQTARQTQPKQSVSGKTNTRLYRCLNVNTIYSFYADSVVLGIMTNYYTRFGPSYNISGEAFQGYG